MPQEVYDAVLDENKVLAAFTAEELEEDPLLFLRCGHIFPTSTMDGSLELGSSYSCTASRDWQAPLELQQQVQFLNTANVAVESDCNVRLSAFEQPNIPGENTNLQ